MTSQFFEEDVVKKRNAPGYGIVERLIGEGDADGSDSDSDVENPIAAQVFWPLAEECTSEPLDDLLVLDRSFLHGDVVSLADAPIGQLAGTITNVRVFFDIRFTASKETLQRVPSRLVRRIHPFRRGVFVVYKSWLARVHECSLDVHVSFSDGSECLLIGVYPDELLPESSLALDSEFPIYPGMSLRPPRRTVFQKAQYLHGSFDRVNHTRGTVTSVQPSSVTLHYVASRTPGEKQPDPEVDAHRLTVVDHFIDDRWQIGDKALVRPTFWQQHRPSFDAIAAARHEEQEASFSSKKKQKKKSISIGGGAFGSNATSSHLGDVRDCVEILCTHTVLDVWWQDGTCSKNVDSTRLVPVQHIQAHDFWPGDFVVDLTSEDSPPVELQPPLPPLAVDGIPTAADSNQNPVGDAHDVSEEECEGSQGEEDEWEEVDTSSDDATENGDNPQTSSIGSVKLAARKLGLVKLVDPDARTCVVQWLDCFASGTSLLPFSTPSSGGAGLISQPPKGLAFDKLFEQLCIMRCPDSFLGAIGCSTPVLSRSSSTLSFPGVGGDCMPLDMLSTRVEECIKTTHGIHKVESEAVFQRALASAVGTILSGSGVSEAKVEDGKIGYETEEVSMYEVGNIDAADFRIGDIVVRKKPSRHPSDPWVGEVKGIFCGGLIEVLWMDNSVTLVSFAELCVIPTDEDEDEESVDSQSIGMSAELESVGNASEVADSDSELYTTEEEEIVTTDDEEHSSIQVTPTKTKQQQQQESSFIQPLVAATASLQLSSKPAQTPPPSIPRPKVSSSSAPVTSSPESPILELNICRFAPMSAQRAIPTAPRLIVISPTDRRKQRLEESWDLSIGSPDGFSDWSECESPLITHAAFSEVVERRQSTLAVGTAVGVLAVKEQELKSVTPEVTKTVIASASILEQFMNEMGGEVKMTSRSSVVFDETNPSDGASSQIVVSFDPKAPAVLALTANGEAPPPPSIITGNERTQENGLGDCEESVVKEWKPEEDPGPSLLSLEPAVVPIGPCFEMVEDVGDHFFAKDAFQTSSRTFASAVRKEWTLLQNHLPDGIFVRAYENRLDLLRAIIIGPVDTPYHSSFLVFDIQLPPDYPLSAPRAHFVSNDLKINPNLYENGHICLSLLGTWTAKDPCELWNSSTSNILQVLVSILGLVLVQQPYYNEAGYDKQFGTQEGMHRSRLYSESSLLQVISHVTRTMRRQPSHCEQLVKQHFMNVGTSMLQRLEAHLTTGSTKSTQNGFTSDGISYPCSAGFLKSLSKALPKLRAGIEALVSGQEQDPCWGSSQAISAGSNSQ